MQPAAKGPVDVEAAFRRLEELEREQRQLEARLAELERERGAVETRHAELDTEYAELYALLDELAGDPAGGEWPDSTPLPLRPDEVVEEDDGGPELPSAVPIAAPIGATERVRPGTRRTPGPPPPPPPPHGAGPTLTMPAGVPRPMPGDTQAGPPPTPPVQALPPPQPVAAEAHLASAPPFYKRPIIVAAAGGAVALLLMLVIAWPGGDDDEAVADAEEPTAEVSESGATVLKKTFSPHLLEVVNAVGAATAETAKGKSQPASKPKSRSRKRPTRRRSKPKSKSKSKSKSTKKK